MLDSRRSISLKTLSLSAYLVMGVLIGFGPWRPLSIILLLVLVVFLLMAKVPRTWPPRIVIQMTFVGLFLLWYFVGFNPPLRVSGETLSRFHFIIFSFYAFLAMVLVQFSRTYRDAALFLLAITVGMLAHAAIVVGATLNTLPPPYYGRVWNPFTDSLSNSPAYSNLAAFFPIVALAFLPLFKPRLFGLVLLVLLASVSIGIGILLAGRTYFIAMIVAVVLGSVLRYGGVKQFAVMSIILVCLVALDAYLYQSLLAYQVGRDFIFMRFEEVGLESSRWDMYGIWIEQVLRDPLGHPAVPHEFVSSWFHNFWMDVYGDSGFAAFFFAVLIFLFPVAAFITGGNVLRADPVERLLLLLPVLAVFLTSIPLFGERAALLFYFAVSIFFLKYSRGVDSEIDGTRSGRRGFGGSRI